MKKILRNKDKWCKEFFLVGFLFFLQLIVFLALVFPISGVLAGVGQNVTVATQLNVGNVFPEILNISIDGTNTSIDLIPNATKTVTVSVIARDFNGEADIEQVSVELYDYNASFYGDSDDNNYHYTNNSCSIDESYGSIYEVQATCTFELWYYAFNSTWQAYVTVIDNATLNDTGVRNTTVNRLLAVGLPDLIDYGTVNATEVSLESQVSVINYGNAFLNLSLSGYAVAEGDGWAMNCSLGSVGNISIDYQKYNLTDSTPGNLNLAAFEATYTNLTSSPVVREFNLPFRLNDLAEDTETPTYWRIYVPLGVAGTCQGNIIFGAVQAPGS